MDTYAGSLCISGMSVHIRKGTNDPREAQSPAPPPSWPHKPPWLLSTLVWTYIMLAQG